MTAVRTLVSLEGRKGWRLHSFSSGPIGGNMGEQKLLLKEKKACKVHTHRKKIKRALVIYAEHTQHLIKSGFIEININGMN